MRVCILGHSLSLSLNLSSHLNVPLEFVVVSKCGSELGEIMTQFVEGSFVMGEEGGKAKCIPVGERKCRGKLKVSLLGLVMVES